MTCRPILDTDLAVIGWFCSGFDSRRYLAHSEVKWCFRCRRYEVHQLVLLYDSKPSWYDPLVLWECPLCGTDSTRFWD